MRIFRTLFISGLLAGSAAGNPININNFSFESAPSDGYTVCAGAGCGYNTASLVPSWTKTDFTNAGLVRPGNPGNTIYFNATMPDGISIAFLDLGAEMTQSTAATVDLGMTYTLQVDVGNRKDKTSALGLVYLTIGSTSISATGSAPAVGFFSTFTATYTGLNADIGKVIGVRLTGPEDGGFGEGDFDNVRLNSSSVAGGVPEPATMTLLGAGLATLAFFRRKLTVG